MDKRTLAKKLLINYLFITLGCVIYSLGVALFLDVANLAAGGVTGIAIVINYLTKLDTGLLIVILNIPMFILGFIFFGKGFTISTIYSTVVSSALIELWTHSLAKFLPLTENLLISAVVGGCLFGFGLGVIFRMGSSTGGTDIIVKILHKKFRFLRTGIISMLVDITIVSVAAIIYKNIEVTFYTVISIIFFTLAFDWILYGGSSAKLIYIISDEEHGEALIKRITTELEMGATFVEGKGGYTGGNRRIIMCAIKNMLYPKLRDVVSETDPNAFMIVTSAKEIYGEGYKKHGDFDL